MPLPPSGGIRPALPSPAGSKHLFPLSLPWSSSCKSSSVPGLEKSFLSQTGTPQHHWGTRGDPARGGFPAPALHLSSTEMQEQGQSQEPAAPLLPALLPANGDSSRYFFIPSHIQPDNCQDQIAWGSYNSSTSPGEINLHLFLLHPCC